MPPNPLHATSIHCCQSMGSGPGHRRRQRRSERCVARLARQARAVNSPSSVGFNLQDNIPACSDRTCSIQMRWLPARGPCTIEVEQCRWWLGQVVLGISRMSLLNIHAILPRTQIQSDRAFRSKGLKSTCGSVHHKTFGLIVRFVINGKKIDREVRNQWETKLIARFVINGKQN